jgi:hypothetical protein
MYEPDILALIYQTGLRHISEDSSLHPGVRSVSPD